MRNGKPLASVASRNDDALVVVRSVGLTRGGDSRLFYTRVGAFALRALTNWDGCGICVITRSKGRETAGPLSDIRAPPRFASVYTNWYEHAIKRTRRTPPLETVREYFLQIDLICLARVTFSFTYYRRSATELRFSSRSFQLSDKCTNERSSFSIFLPFEGLRVQEVSEVERLVLFSASCKHVRY